jgi:hypothetical protein
MLCRFSDSGQYNQGMPTKPVNWRKAQQKAAKTARWAVTMTKVRIRKVTARTRWQLVTFYGRSGGESVGIVDLLAIRKDHRRPTAGLGRGDVLQIVLIQVKGGLAPKPTANDWRRLRAVADRHGATEILLAAWSKGKAAQFFRPDGNATSGRMCWRELSDLDSVFR